MGIVKTTVHLKSSGDDGLGNDRQAVKDGMPPGTRSSWMASFNP